MMQAPLKNLICGLLSVLSYLNKSRFCEVLNLKGSKLKFIEVLVIKESIM